MFLKFIRKFLVNLDSLYIGFLLFAIVLHFGPIPQWGGINWCL